MNRYSLFFTAPETVQVQGESVNKPRRDQVMVETKYSAISSGTELLLYTDNIPENMPVDLTLDNYSGIFAYPMKYGYATVGRVTDVGRVVDPTWVGKTVFSFHPHETHFLASETELIPLPDDLAPEDALFLPTMESAINFVMDGEPLIGERVAIFGQGIVGLLTTALLSRYPLEKILTFDFHELRRKQSTELGAAASFHPEKIDESEKIKEMLSEDDDFIGADLLFELSGASEALNDAIDLAGYESRIIVGSWYGAKKPSLNLGNAFHREHLRIISSQVSQIPSRFTGRWTKQRRLDVTISLLRQIKPSQFITHRISFNDAPKAYQLLHEKPEEALQVIFKYQT